MTPPRRRITDKERLDWLGDAMTLTPRFIGGGAKRRRVGVSYRIVLHPSTTPRAYTTDWRDEVRAAIDAAIRSRKEKSR